MKKILLILVMLFGIIGITGCSCKSYTILKNIQTDADSFNTYRKVTVINLRSDKVLLEIEGYISLKNSTEDELAIIIMTGINQYKMHYVYTRSEIVYLVEQLENTTTDPYHWKIRIFAVTPDFDIGRDE